MTLAIVTASLPAVQADTPVSLPFKASGGVGAYHWSSSELPLGLVQDALSGTIAGIASAPFYATITVSVADSGSPAAHCSANFTLDVKAAPLSVATATFPDAVTGTVYETTARAIGGTKPYHWSITGGQLPAGLDLDPSGVISGIGHESLYSTFTLQVVDTTGASANASLSIGVTGAEWRDLASIPVSQATVTQLGWLDSAVILACPNQGYASQTLLSTSGGAFVQAKGAQPAEMDGGGILVSGGGRLWLVGGNDSVGLVYAFDLPSQSWRLLSQSGPFAGGAFAACWFDDQLWVVGSGRPALYSSPDGVKWAVHSLPPCPGRGRLSPGLSAFSGKLWIAGGYWMPECRGQWFFNLADVWSTTDGDNWERGNDVPGVGPQKAALGLVATEKRLYALIADGIADSGFGPLSISAMRPDGEWIAPYSAASGLSTCVTWPFGTMMQGENLLLATATVDNPAKINIRMYVPGPMTADELLL